MLRSLLPLARRTSFTGSRRALRSLTHPDLTTLRGRGILTEFLPSDKNVGDISKSKGQQTIYVGIDPTASSLHVGHLPLICTVLHAQSAGHRVLVVLGGATGMIGDPSGRDQGREKLAGTVIDLSLIHI